MSPVNVFSFTYYVGIVPYFGHIRLTSDVHMNFVPLSYVECFRMCCQMRQTLAKMGRSYKVNSLKPMLRDLEVRFVCLP
jgi:hypothetical protein